MNKDELFSALNRVDNDLRTIRHMKVGYEDMAEHGLVMAIMPMEAALVTYRTELCAQLGNIILAEMRNV